MKIAFVVGKFPKLSKTFIINQIVGLLECGHEVDIYAFPNPNEGEKLHAVIEEYHLLKNTFFLEYVPKNDIKKLIKAIIYLVAFNYRSPKRFMRLLFSSGKFQRKINSWIYSVEPSLRKNSYDIIHCHFAENGNDALCIQDILSNKARLVVTFHGYDVNVTTNKCNPEAYRELFRKSDRFTANTHFTAQRAVKLGCPIDKIDILPVGLDSTDYEFTPRQPNPTEPIRVLTVGRLVEKKGIKYALCAISIVKAKRPDIAIHYSIVGEGDLRNMLEGLAQKLEITDRVNFLGAMTQEEVRTEYSQAHMFVLSSVTATNGDMEGQGLVLQEAQCMGLPVISTLHNGIPDGVLDGKSGFLVPEKDAEALADKLIDLADNPQSWPEIGRTGHEFVCAHYDIHRLNGRLVDLYRQLTDGE